MRQEWRREKVWTDRHSTVFQSWEEYTYVAEGAAWHGLPVNQRKDSVDERDKLNQGKRIADFLADTNSWIAKRGPTLGLKVESLLLNLDEAISVRLYTGPCYAPLNEFLRESAKQSTEWRLHAAKDATVTYSATINNLCSAIRKLTKVSDCPEKLYRGVRGELPQAFWLRDRFGEVTALELSLMSTSASEEVSASFLGPVKDESDGGGHEHNQNLMWEVHSRGAGDSGYHSGADVSRLSQFPNEKEVLFPPLTSLRVHLSKDDGSGSRRLSQDAQSSTEAIQLADKEAQLVRTRVDLDTAKGLRRYSRVVVTPTFI